MAYEIVVTKDGAPISSVSVTDAQVKCLEHKLLDVDASTFAVASKIETCSQAIIEDYTPILAADPTVTAVPTDPIALVELIQARPDYKTRAEKEAEEDAKAKEAEEDAKAV